MRREEMKTDFVYNMDALEFLKTLPDNSVQCIVTSPPYYQQRNYGGLESQVGLEETFEIYLDNLIKIFEEALRVIRYDGVFWLNIGDKYSNNKSKDKLLLPFHIALRCQETGWIMRADIVWSKKNAHPESVKDRPSTSHEYVFMMTKSAKYQYFQDKELQPARYKANYRPPAWFEQNVDKEESKYIARIAGIREPKKMVNLRTVWHLSVNTDKSVKKHFGVMPLQLAERCVGLSTKPGDMVLDMFMGAGTTALAAKRKGCYYIGSELNPEYVEMANIRVANDEQARTANMF